MKKNMKNNLDKFIDENEILETHSKKIVLKKW